MPHVGSFGLYCFTEGLSCLDGFLVDFAVGNCLPFEDGVFVMINEKILSTTQTTKYQTSTVKESYANSLIRHYIRIYLESIASQQGLGLKRTRKASKYLLVMKSDYYCSMSLHV